MKKRLLCLALILCLGTAPFLTAYALDGYYPGPTKYVLSTSYCTSLDKAAVEGEILSLEAGGKADFGFYLPFNSASVTITYETALSGNVQITAGQKQYTIALDPESTQAETVFGISERKGERDFSFSSTVPVRIQAIEFQKEQIMVPNLPMMELNLSEFEEATFTTVLVDRNASMLMVNGAKRYIDIENPTEKPAVFNESIYLPTHTLARALGFYYEDMPEKNYVLLRNHEIEFGFTPDYSYCQVNSADKEAIENKVIYQNGESFLPVRYFAEAIGKTVGYKDGIVIIDDKYSVSNILNNETLFSTVNSTFEPFRSENTGGRTLYVAQTPNASDDNDGSMFKPFRTLAKASAQAQAGDTVIIREGIYREVLAPKNNGTATDPIIFQAAEGENVVISANEELTGFAEYKDGIITHSMGWDLGDGRNQIFYNNESLIEARYPNGPALSDGTDGTPQLSALFPVQGDLQVTAEDKNIIVSDTLLDQEPDYWKGATFVSLHGAAYTLGSAKVSSSQKGQLKVSDTSVNWWWPNDVDGHNYGYLTGHMNCLDAPGEWIIQNNTLYLIPPEGVDIQNFRAEAKARQLVMDLENSKYVQVKGIQTIGGSVKMNNSEMCVIDGVDMKYISHFTHSKDQRDGFIDDANRYDPNGAPSRGEVGIYVGGSDNAIVNSKIDHSAASAIYGVGKYLYIENNIISNCSYMGSYISGITFGVEAWKDARTLRGGFAIYNNTLYNAGRSLMNLGTDDNKWSDGIVPFIPFEVAYNDFHDGILFSQDTGIIYECAAVMGFEKLKSKLHDNIFYYTLPDEKHMSAAIYHDGYAEGVDTYNNVIFTTREDNGFTMGGVFKQPQIATGASLCDVWNNSVLNQAKPGGIASLMPNEYPNGKPFYAGAFQGAQEYLYNYNALKSNTTEGFAYAKDAELSEGVTLSDGMAVFSGNDQWIKFKDVDFKDGNNILQIQFKGDYLNTGDKVQIVVGDDMENGRKFDYTLEATSPYLDHNNFVSTPSLSLRGFQGKQTVYIKTTDYKSAQIDKVTTTKFFTGVDTDETLAGLVYGGNYSDFTAGDATMPPVKSAVAGDKLNQKINNTWPGTVLVYRNVEIYEDADTLAMCVSSEGQHAGQTLEIRLGSATAAPIGQIVVPDSGWDNYGITESPLNSILKAGTYDIYLTASTKDVNTTSNLYWFGFRKIQN